MKAKEFKFTLYLGLNDKDTKQQEVSTLEAYKVVKNMIVSRFGGGTIFEALGVYTHDDGTITTEKTLRIELLFTNDASVRDFVQELKSAFNQESVAVEKSVINSELW